jgi:hyaluronan synthase
MSVPLEYPSTPQHLSFHLDEPEGRRPPRIRLIPCIIKLVLSFGLVSSVIVGYALAFKVVKIGPLSLGLYGVILLVDFLMQFSCALLNRRAVNRIAAVHALGAARDTDIEKASSQASEPRADISIVAVGYREDEDTWRKCLRSLQQQTLQPRSLIVVVDGNDSADMVMADIFRAEFKGQNAKVIHLPVLLSRIYRETYNETLAAGKAAPGGMTTFWRWLRAVRTPNEVEAHKVARDRIINEVLTWDNTDPISSYSAVCITQPHCHKRVRTLLISFRQAHSLTILHYRLPCSLHFLLRCTVFAQKMRSSPRTRTRF